jgi:hypothetical protein
MKKIIFLLALFPIGLTATAQWEPAKQIFESPKLSSEVAKHKVVAIIPFDVMIKYRKQPKNFSAEANRAQELSMSTSIQQSLFTYLLKDKYSVSFQDVDKTNALLKKSGAADSLSKFTKDELAKILGVDAILGGKFQTEQTASDGAALAGAILLGMKGKTGTGTLFLTLNNSTDGELLWRFVKTMDDTIMGSTDNLVERMMRKVSRNFPYNN